MRIEQGCFLPFWGSSALCVGPKGWAQTSGPAHDLGIRRPLRTSGSAGRSCALFGRTGPCRACFSPISVHPGPAWPGTVSAHDVAGAYTAQRALRRFPCTTRHGGGGRALYTGDPVRTGVCTLGAAYTAQTPVGTSLLVRKVPVAASGHCAPPPAATSFPSCAVRQPIAPLDAS